MSDLKMGDTLSGLLVKMSDLKMGDTLSGLLVKMSYLKMGDTLVIISTHKLTFCLVQRHHSSKSLFGTCTAKLNNDDVSKINPQ